MGKRDVTVIGAAVMDVLAGAAGPEVFRTGSMPMDFIRTSYGGDALNEAVVLSRLGKNAELVTRLGSDDVGVRLTSFLSENGVGTEHITVTDEQATSVNIVLVDDGGERFFLTDPETCLRKLSAADILPHVHEMAKIVSFASIFVSPVLDIPALEQVFREIKKPGSIGNGKEGECIPDGAGVCDRILLTDVTKPKKGETLEDIACLLPYIDYFLANEDEIAMLTGEADAFENARRVVDAGAGCAVIKRGSKGCIICAGASGSGTASDGVASNVTDGSGGSNGKSGGEMELYEIPAYKDCHVVDSTGAGDSFAAGFLYGLSEGFSLEDCGRFGCAVASCLVEAVGGSAGVESLEEPLRRFEEMKVD